MRNFSEMLLDLQLMDLPCEGHNTLCQEGMTLYKPQELIDHKALLLQGEDWDSTPSYFKFENTWLQQVGFTDMVKRWWQNYTTGTRKKEIKDLNLPVQASSGCKY
ncbi:hypothetical protein H5410_009808 [Solanum commersonii]|uniref:Uncharacterized protein n=1 Tax=Solanum commersonii TaxID=4109 RepID=A0A9J6AIZ4_SOLCO|nr:hypothetical protein H5410_009808 [Solanum commersonii]